MTKNNTKGNKISHGFTAVVSLLAAAAGGAAITHEHNIKGDAAENSLRAALDQQDINTLVLRYGITESGVVKSYSSKYDSKTYTLGNGKMIHVMDLQSDYSRIKLLDPIPSIDPSDKRYEGGPTGLISAQFVQTLEASVGKPAKFGSDNIVSATTPAI